MPPTHAFTSPLKGSIAIKPACSICLQYLIESYGVIMVSLYLLLFHAKTFMWVLILKDFLISSSAIWSCFIFFHRSVCFIAASIMFSCPFHTVPFFIFSWLLRIFFI